MSNRHEAKKALSDRTLICATDSSHEMGMRFSDRITASEDLRASLADARV